MTEDILDIKDKLDVLGLKLTFIIELLNSIPPGHTPDFSEKGSQGFAFCLDAFRADIESASDQLMEVGQNEDHRN